MLDNKGFDRWSGKYDNQILEMQEMGYPFEGYYNTLGYIQGKVREGRANNVLDIGIGTGLLTETLYKDNLKITGVDFSDKMLILAKEKMPRGRFVKFDFSEGLPIELKGEKFDYIISSYALHHIDNDQKVVFIRMLMQNLRDSGFVLIGDIAFETRAEMERVRKLSTDWDEEEFYMIGEEIIDKLRKYHFRSEFVKTSNCSGVLVLQAW